MRGSFGILPGILLILFSCRLEPSQRAEILSLAEENYLKGNFLRAFHLYKMLFDEKLPEIYLRSGICLIKLKDYAKAKKLLQKALGLSKSPILRIRIYEKLAYLAELSGDPKEALRYLSELALYSSRFQQEALDTERFLYSLGINHLRCGDWQRGYSFLERYRQKFPEGKFIKRVLLLLALRKESYYIQFGYFHNSTNAKRLVKELSKKGIHATIHEVLLPARKVFVVLGRGFNSWQEAEKHSRILKEKGVEHLLTP